MLSTQGVAPQSLEVKSFKGGMTDNFISASPDKFEKADNFYINYDEKLITRPGLRLHDEDYPRVTANDRIGSVFELMDQIFQQSGRNIYYNDAGFTTLQGISGNAAFSIGSSTQISSYAKWNSHVFAANDAYSKIMKIYKSAGVFKVANLGLPALATDPVVTPAAGALNYVYGFHFKHTYTSNGITFEENGPVTLVAVASAAEPSVGNPSAITALPTITNGVTGNYDTANITLEIYRSIQNGDVLYHVASKTLGAATHNDTTLDANLDTILTIYTTGDVLEDQEPYPAKFIHSVNDILITAYTKEDGVEYPNRVRFSKRFQQYSFPDDFYEDFEEETVGVSSINIYPLIFCKNSIYRIEGYYDAQGNGTVIKKRISDSIGAISNRSIVQTQDGCFFAGNDGFYFTDGSKVVRISEDIPNTYRSYTETASQKSAIVGTYDTLNKRILWMMKSDSGLDECDVIMVCHIKWGMRPDTPFTTWTGNALLSTNFEPSFIFQNNNIIYHADSRGYLFTYDDAAFTDLKIDTALAVDEWRETTIIYEYMSPAFDFGSATERKAIPWVIVNCDNASSVSLLISGANDNSDYFRDLMEVKYKGNIEWGDYDIEWGDANMKWNYFPIISAKRRFPAGGLRCSYKQLRFTNSYTVIEDSATLGTMSVDGTTEVATLDNLTNTLPRDVLDYYFSNDSDDYTAQYRIDESTDTTLTLEDLDLQLDDLTNVEWKIKGYRRREILKVISYVIKFGTTSSTQDTYRGDT